MRYLSLPEVLEVHGRLVASSGGSSGVRDLASLESAVAQPHAAFGGDELYPDIVTKAAALCFSLVMNHPFVDGNKRIGHAAMETFLILNGHEFEADVDEQEEAMLALAAGKTDRDTFVSWIRSHVGCAST